jgi:hypothetical protein
MRSIDIFFARELSAIFAPNIWAKIRIRKVADPPACTSASRCIHAKYLSALPFAPDPSRAIFAFGAASIFRLVFFVNIRTVYQTELPISNFAVGSKNEAHFMRVAFIFGHAVVPIR